MKPVFKIVYEKKDITADVSQYVTMLTYTDFLTGKSDSIDIEFDDKSGLWKSEWYPQKGDTIEIFLGYEAETLLKCGRFQIDETEIQGPPDIFVLRGLSTPIKGALRTKKTKSYTQQSLKQIATTIAASNGLSVVGDIESVMIDRIIQKHEEDLSFLNRLAEQYGYVFKVASDALVFYRVEILEAKRQVAVLTRGQVTRFSFRDKAQKSYSKIGVKYFDPDRRTIVEDFVSNPQSPTGETLAVSSRATSLSLAKRKAAELKKETLRSRTEASVDLAGDPRLVSGMTVEIQGFGKMSGLFIITKASHRIDRNSGFVTAIDMRRV
jgi:uncharacterized protein